MAEGPTTRRRRLAIELRRCREQAGVTQEEVSRHFEWHIQKVSRIEKARVKVTARDVKDMLALYGFTDETHLEYREKLADMARNSKERGWWMDYRDIIRSGNFISVEAEASSVRIWEPIIVPGLFQTEKYMLTLMNAWAPTERPEQEFDRQIEVRRTRQARLTSETDQLYVSAIIDESVIYRRIGNEADMREQLQHLLALSEMPNINLQVLPFAAGAHGLLGGPAALVEFPDESDLDTVYLEGIAGDFSEDEPAEVAKYRRIFERLQATALNRSTSAKLIKKSLT